MIGNRPRQEFAVQAVKEKISMKSAAIVAAALALSATVMPAEPLPVARPSGPPQGAQEAMSNGTCAWSSTAPHDITRIVLSHSRDDDQSLVALQAARLACAGECHNRGEARTDQRCVDSRADLRGTQGSTMGSSRSHQVVVRNGVVHLSGRLVDERQRGAIRAAAENIPGVKAVEDHLVWIDPVSGIAIHAF